MLPPQGWYGTDCSRPVEKVASQASQEPPALGEPRPPHHCTDQLKAAQADRAAALLHRASHTTLSGRATAEAQPHLREVLVLPPALHTPSQARKRPLIYVYDLDPIFNTRILQYRMGKCAAQLGGACTGPPAGACMRLAAHEQPPLGAPPAALQHELLR